MSKKATFKWVLLPENVLVLFSTAGSVADEEWKDFMSALKVNRITKLLATSEGSIDLDSIKRKQGSATLSEGGIRVASVTDDRLVRGLVTAVAWFGVNIKAFSWSELEDAAKSLDMSKATQDRAVAEILKLKASVR